MSRTLVVQLHTDVARQDGTILMKDQGLGAVVIDQLPFYGRGHGDTLQAISRDLAPMYFYCAPRTTTKSITMTWDQAVKTAEFLKETI